MKYLAIIFLLVSGALHAQTIDGNTACSDLLPRPLEFLLDGSLTSEEALAKKLAPLKDCGLDDYDIQFFGSMDKMSAILKKLTASSTVNSLTYQDLLEQMELVKKAEVYQRIKKTTLLSEELGKRVGTETTWEKDMEVFIELGASQRIIDGVGIYLHENPNNQKSYREILEIISNG
jgi:hypothetical protein